MPDANKTEIVVILDRSGSMASMKKDMEGGFEKFRADQAAQPGECVLTLVQFDSGGIETVHESMPIKDVPRMVLHPRGNTPLLDAVGTTIQRVGARLERLHELERPGRVLVLIITDGEENASKKFSKEQVKAMVKLQEETYKWAFIYLGANVDAFAEAGAMGIVRAQSANYTPRNATAAYAVASLASTRYRGSGLVADAGLTDDERKRLVQ